MPRVSYRQVVVRPPRRRKPEKRRSSPALTLAGAGLLVLLVLALLAEKSGLPPFPGAFALSQAVIVGSAVGIGATGRAVTVGGIRRGRRALRRSRRRSRHEPRRPGDALDARIRAAGMMVLGFLVTLSGLALLVARLRPAG